MIICIKNPRLVVLNILIFFFEIMYMGDNNNFIRNKNKGICKGNQPHFGREICFQPSRSLTRDAKTSVFKMQLFMLFYACSQEIQKPIF